MENNKHLVDSGREFAAKIDIHTAIIDIVRKMAELTEALAAEIKRSEALTVERDAVNADNVYLRDQVLCWARECDRITYTHTNKITDAHQSEAEQELANTVQSTGAFLAEVRAQGVEMYAANLDSGADDAERRGFDDAVKFLQSEASAVRLFAAQLRGEKTA